MEPGCDSQNRAILIAGLVDGNNNSHMHDCIDMLFLDTGSSVSFGFLLAHQFRISVGYALESQTGSVHEAITWLFPLNTDSLVDIGYTQIEKSLIGSMANIFFPGQERRLYAWIEASYMPYLGFILAGNRAPAVTSG